MSHLNNKWSMLKSEHYHMGYELSKNGKFSYFEKVKNTPFLN